MAKILSIFGFIKEKHDSQEMIALLIWDGSL
jgi:hypothetical protein